MQRTVLLESLAVLGREIGVSTCGRHAAVTAGKGGTQGRCMQGVGRQGGYLPLCTMAAPPLAAPTEHNQGLDGHWMVRREDRRCDGAVAPPHHMVITCGRWGGVGGGLLSRRAGSSSRVDEMGSGRRAHCGPAPSSAPADTASAKRACMISGTR